MEAVIKRHPDRTHILLLRRLKHISTWSIFFLQSTSLIVRPYSQEVLDERTPLNGSSAPASRKSWNLIKAYTILLILSLATIVILYIGLSLPDAERQVRRQRRASWAIERKEHDAQHVEWERQLADHESEAHAMAVERQHWDEERVAHEREHEEWRRERRQREHERVEWEVERHDEDRRAGMRLFWESPLTVGHCQAWGAREYWAKLWNVEPGYNATRACQRTPVVIHDTVIMQPDWCEDSVSGLINYSDASI